MANKRTYQLTPISKISDEYELPIDYQNFTGTKKTTVGNLLKDGTVAHANSLTNPIDVSLIGAVTGTVTTDLSEGFSINTQLNPDGDIYSTFATKTALADETTQRISSDTTLQQNISSEISARISTETSILEQISDLDNKLDIEINTREEQDNVIQQNAEPTIAVGTSSDYYAGDKTWKDLGNDVRSTVLTGLSTADSTPIVDTDSILIALGKLQSQNNIQSGTANLTNTLSYPFNNSTYTVALSPAMTNTDYIINIEPPTDLGGTIGRIVISDKLVNGFKISYTGSATSADFKWIVKG